eukprot:COSAG03_NODE_34541_length_125_cov_73.346154_1_plen_30_part_10
MVVAFGIPAAVGFVRTGWTHRQTDRQTDRQ